MAAEPLISVVVASRDRRDRVARLLEALDNQRDAPPFEVVVVDDGSVDGTSQELKGLATQTRVPLTAERLETSRGQAAARNVGWRRARGRLIAFTDDDCVPQPGWLAALARSLADADVVQGRTLPDPEQLVHRNAFSHTVVVEDEWGFYEACNIGYHRRLLDEVGGFDETFGRSFGEDADLAWRVKRRGARVAFEPGALVYHDVRRQSYLDHLLDLRRRQGIVRAVKRNPEMRYLCHYGVFWRPAHPSATWAAAGLATITASRRSPWRALAGVAMCAPYIRYRTHTYPTGRPRNRPVVIPLALASDLVEMGILAVASARYRTLLL